MKSKNEFFRQVRLLKKIKSKTGTASYSNLRLAENILSFKRDNTGIHWKLKLDDVYEAYTKERFINTVVLRKYVTNRVFSPSLALLIATKFCDERGNRIPN